MVGSRIALSRPQFMARTVKPKLIIFRTGRLKEMLLTAAVMWMEGYFSRTVEMTSVLVSMPFSEVHSISTRGSMCRRLGEMPYSLALAMILSKTFSRSAALLGMPVSSLSRAMTSQPGLAAMMGKILSILSPSPETELKRPGLLQNLYASVSTSALGLSTEMGKSVTS